MSPRRCRLLAVGGLAFWLAAASVGRGDLLRVPVDFPTLQSGIDGAQAGDTIVLSEGVYTGAGNHSIDFRGKALVVRSITGPQSTIIDAQASKLDRRRVMRFGPGTDASTRIEGITIRGGWAPGDGPHGESWGGGVLCDTAAAPLFIDCVFRNNAAARGGGGIACIFGAAPVLRDCQIIDNESLYGSPEPTGGWGGGLGGHAEAAPHLIRCLIQGNRGNLGGGLALVESTVRLDSCRIEENLAPYLQSFVPASAGNGGGLLLARSRAVLHECVIARNRAQAHPALGARGGGLAAFSSLLTMTGCTVHQNTAESVGLLKGAGAGLYCSYTSPQLERCILSFNFEGEAIYCIDLLSSPQLVCCDVYGNEGGDWVERLAPQAGGNGNLWADPAYCRYPAGTLQLSDHSPCLPPNNDCGVQIGAEGLGCVATDIDVSVPSSTGPGRLVLGPPAPNPFNDAVALVLHDRARGGGAVMLEIFNVSGRCVRHLYSGPLPRSEPFRIAWDGCDDRGRRLPSGVYIVRADDGDRPAVRKLLLLK